MNIEKLTPELLSLVVEEKIELDKTHLWCIENNDFFFYKTVSNWYEGTYINIDTLTRKMKEFCYKQGYTLVSGKEDKAWCDYYYSHFSDNDKPIGYIVADTEFEAVLEAFIWVVNEKKLLDAK